MAKKTYVALTAIQHDHQDYAPGDEIELDDKKQAPQLLEVGAIKPGEKKAAQKAVEPDPPAA